MEASSSQFQKIQIYISGRNLKDLDTYSKSDPYVIVSYKRDFSQKTYAILGRTQTKDDNLNPDYAKSFPIDYIFESRQDIRFDVFDDDENGNQDDFIGFVETTVGALMGARSQTSILDLKNDKGSGVYGKLIVRCLKLTESNQYFKMKWRAQKLCNTDSFFDFWDKSDPYIKLLKIRDDNTDVEIKRSEVVKDNLNPSWHPIDVPASQLINLNKQAFKLQVWDWEENGKDKFIGEAIINLNILKSNTQIVLTNPKVKTPGTLILQLFHHQKQVIVKPSHHQQQVIVKPSQHQQQVIVKPSFIDYLRGGVQLNMIVAIDFTGSNGSPKDRNSLHYQNPNAPNQYQMAIASIAQILMNYDSDKRIPAFGFGAQTRFSGPNGPKMPVSHCFALSGNPNKVEACGVKDLMTMYKEALQKLQLSGPTRFSSILSQTMKLASLCKQNGSNTYQTLLIITDGEINDMHQTIDLLIQAAHLPLSVIIVGVGETKFDGMNKLDGDGGLYGSNGVAAQRDIVQFVPFRDVKMNGDLLAKELLAQLPGQLVRYMQMIGKPPGQFVPPNLQLMMNLKQEIKKV